MAKFLGENNRLVMSKDDVKCLKLKWMAPEAIFYDKLLESSFYYVKSDVWSYGEAELFFIWFFDASLYLLLKNLILGIFLYELITLGSEPFTKMSMRDLKIKLSNDNYFLPKPDRHQCPDDYYSTILLCCEKNPDERPSFHHLAVFFKKYFSTTREIFNYTSQTTYL